MSDSGGRAEAKSTSAVNVPNALTVLRLVLVPVFLWLLLENTTASRWWALAVFAVAAYTDHLDGEIARKHNIITNFGKTVPGRLRRVPLPRRTLRRRTRLRARPSRSLQRPFSTFRGTSRNTLVTDSWIDTVTHQRELPVRWLSQTWWARLLRVLPGAPPGLPGR